MKYQEYSPLEVMQNKVLIQGNREMIKNATGDMKTQLRKIKYLKPLLIYLYDKQMQQMDYRFTNSDVTLRVTMWDIKLNAFKQVKTQPEDENIKRLLGLLILSGCIERVTFDELTRERKSNYTKQTTIIFQSLNMIYRINDLRNANFERLKGMDKDFNYTIISIKYGVELANKVFQEFTPHNEHYHIADKSMNDVVSYIKDNKVVDLESVSAWHDKRFLKPYDEIKNDLRWGDNGKFYKQTYKKLDDFNYWKQFNIKIIKNKDSRKKIKGVHGNSLVFVYGR